MDGMSDDVLSRPGAGHAAIRGGITRLAGYLAGTVVGTVSSIVLLRYLGVATFGRYATVMAIVGIVTGLSDPGLLMTAQREYVVEVGAEARDVLVASLIGLRTALTVLVGGGALALAAAAGYPPILVAGVGLGAVGVLVAHVGGALLVPPTASLRYGLVTAVGIVRDVAGAATLLLLVAVGAGLLPFFAISTIAAIASTVVTTAVIGRRSLRVRFSWAEWKPLLAAALPLGLSSAIAILYLRALLVTTSLVTSTHATGLFALSDRIIEVVVGGVAVMLGAAFPILARAGGDADDERLGYVVQQLFNVAVFAAVFGVLVFAIAARPIVTLLGGSEYADSARLLRIQCFALFGSFVGMAWFPALVALRRLKALVFVNVAGVLTIAVVGGVLIPLFGVTGTAVAAVLGEAAIAAAGAMAFARARSGQRPQLGAGIKMIGAGASVSLFAFVPGLPDAVAATLAAGTFVALSWWSGAMPRDPIDALLALRRR